MPSFFHVEVRVTLDVFAAISTFLLLYSQYKEVKREKRRLNRWETVADKLDFLTERFRRKEN